MKQLTEQQWQIWFTKYEYSFSQFKLDEFWEELYHARGLHNKIGNTFWMMTNLKSRFIAKYKKFKKLSDNNFMSKMKTNKGRRRINENNVHIKDEMANKVIDELDETKAKNLLKYFVKKYRDELTVDESRKVIKELEENIDTKLDTRQEYATMFGIDRRSLNNKILPKERVRKGEEHLEEIRQVSKESNQIYGRDKIYAELVLRGIIIPPSQLGVIMRENGLNCVVKRHKDAPKPKEPKDTTVEMPNLIRDLVDKNKHWIIALDVSYIPISDGDGWGYLSIAINHETKLIEGYNFSKSQNAEEVLKVLSTVKPRENLILHSDHGSQYSSDLMRMIVHALGARQSMSEVGNSLENREAEYFFSCIKSEWLSRKQTHLLTFNQVKKLIDEYIWWYNNIRIQKNLGYISPMKYANQGFMGNNF